MNSNKFWAAVGRVLAVVIVSLILVALLAPSAGAAKFKALHNFKPNHYDGLLPYGSLVFDAAGNLYGTTESGGGIGYDWGTVFKLAPNADGSWSESLVYSFAAFLNHDGQDPLAGLIIDQAGNLYGTTAYDGGAGGGTVFELTPNPDGSWTESVLHFFGYDAGGYRLSSALVLDSAGNLYGTTEYGGAYDNGVVFKLSRNPDGSWTENVLYNFTGGNDGAIPGASLVFDAAGNLYGTTSGSGVYGGGNVFKLSPNLDGSWTETVLHSFAGGSDGAYSCARVIFDAAGNLYGTTFEGGAYDSGTVFRLRPTVTGRWKHTVLHAFNGTDGATPYAGVILDQLGRLYGTTRDGGAYGYGTVFRLRRVAGTWKEKVLRSFNNRPQAYPQGDLIFDAAGNLYGTTVGHDRGMSCKAAQGPCGSVFEIAP